jgi:thiamine-monophosphate kinase
MQVRELGEFALIARLTRGELPHAGVHLGVGDDTAILDIGSGYELLATCDVQVEGRHFIRGVGTPEQLGRRALAINLSDIAAMGGEPLFALISLLLPPTLEVAFLDGVYTGLREEGRVFGVAIVGGNISGIRAELVIDITLLGRVRTGTALRRDGARPGDVVLVTGSLGTAAAGLALIMQPDVPVPAEARTAVSRAFHEPVPRIREGQVLAQTAMVTAAIDISDGLSGDVAHICERSNVGVIVQEAALPVADATRTVAEHLGRSVADLALHGGEDYELLFTAPPSAVPAVMRAVQQATGTPVTAIGTITTPDMGLQLERADGTRVPLRPQSWDHLREST